MSDEPKGTLREHEKFWAFVLLILAVIGLVILASTFDIGKGATDLVTQAKIRIIDAAVAGLLTITGMAAQALFRVSSTDRISAETALEAARKLPDPAPAEPTKVEVMNTPEKPAFVSETHPQEPEFIPHAK